MSEGTGRQGQGMRVHPKAHGRYSGGTRWLAAGALVLAALGSSAQALAQSADLVLSNHVVSPDPVRAGGEATIVLTISNNGQGTANDVVLTDTLPAGASFISLSASDGGSCTAAAPYQCTWSSIPFPGVRTATLKVYMPTSGVRTNVAEASSSTPDPNPSNNRSERTITTVAAANLGITATSSAATGTAAGTAFNYALTVSNGGPDPLPAGQSPRVTFNVPAGTSVTARPTGTGWTCTPDTGYPHSNPATVITCARNAGNDGLASGATWPTIQVPAVSNVQGTVTASFDVTSNFADGDELNNTAVVDAVFESGTDMSIAKTASVTAQGTDTLVTYTLTPRQNGGVAPTNVTVTDTLPAGLVYVSHSAPSPWACTWTAPVLSCQIPGDWTGGPYTNLPAITLRATVDSASPIVNTGHVQAEQTDPTPGNNQSSVSVQNAADLRIAKVASISPVVPGQDYDWRITVTNGGPMQVLTGQTLTITESIPAGMRVQSRPSSTGWSCSSSAGDTFPQDGPVMLTCVHTRTSALGNNSSAPVLVVPVVHTASGALTNTACVILGNAGPSDPNNSNNCVGSGNTATDDRADLSITKTASGDVAAGDLLTYTLVASNAGPQVATNVVVTDVLSNLINAGGIQSVVASQGTCDPATAPVNTTGRTVECQLGTLGVGASATVTIVVRPNNTTAANLARSNTATVNSLDVGDPNRANNSATVTSNVEPRVDVRLSKSATPGTVRVGEPLVYVITATNAGPSAAAEVTITDPMPPNTAFISAVASNSGTCTTPAVDATSGTVVCSWSAAVSVNAARTVTLRLRPLAEAVGTTITNTASVSTTTVETDTTNNSASASAQVIPAELDLLVHKTESIDPVPLGGETEYTVTVTNVGPSYGTNLVVTDTFPSGDPSALFSYQGGLTVTVGGVTVDASVCVEPAPGETSGSLVCRFESIGPGASNAVVLKYRMKAESIRVSGDYSGTHGNAARVAVDETETEADNNVTEEFTTTRRDAIATDLALVKSIDKTTLAPGEEAVYTLTVTNDGPLESRGAQVIDTLPAGMSFVASADGCVSSGAMVTCSVGTLGSGETRAFSFQVRLDDPYSGTSPIVNTATLDAPGDTNPDNNTSSTSTRVPAAEPAVAVPTLGQWALLLLLASLAALGGQRLRRRH